MELLFLVHSLFTKAADKSSSLTKPGSGKYPEPADRNVTNAFRFWFTNSAFDYGYTLRRGCSRQEAKFDR